MEDGWTDRKKRTFINFLVYCPKGTDFLESIDAFHASKSTDLFFKLFKYVVLHVSPENVVHIVTQMLSIMLLLVGYWKRSFLNCFALLVLHIASI